HTMARQLFIDAWQVPLWQALSSSNDPTLAGIAQKALKEAKYHLRHSSTWVVRLGDGTEESHRRMQAAVDRLWRYTGEMFMGDDVEEAMVEAGIGVDPASLRPAWDDTIEAVFAEAGLERPDDDYVRTGGRVGFHGGHLGHLRAAMQWTARPYPGRRRGPPPTPPSAPSPTPSCPSSPSRTWGSCAGSTSTTPAPSSSPSPPPTPGARPPR